MRRLTKTLMVSLLIMALSFSAGLEAEAEEKVLDREEAFSLLDQAFQAQVSLSELERSKAEIKSILDPYFTNEYQEKFLKENLVEENGKYFVLGSDLAQYFIPFFQYTENTKVVSLGEKLYIVEHFEASGDGPVNYDSHYEAIELKWANGSWKVGESYNGNVPGEVLDKAYGAEEEVVSADGAEEDERLVSLSRFMPLAYLSAVPEESENSLSMGWKDFINHQVPSMFAFSVKPFGIDISVK